MIQGLVVFVWLVVCAQQDIRQRQIANRLTLGALLLALFYLLWSGSTWLGTSRAQGLWAFCLALLLTLPGYALGRLGAGDVKMLAALALASNSTYLLWSLIGAGVANVAWLVYGRGCCPLPVKVLERAWVTWWWTRQKSCLSRRFF